MPWLVFLWFLSFALSCWLGVLAWFHLYFYGRRKR